MPDVISDETVVIFHYHLKNEAGDTLDKSGDSPMPYLHGAQNIVPGLEKEMTGKKAGDSFSAVVPPEEGYGPRHEGGIQQVPREAFPADVEIEPGMPFMLQTEQGQMVTIWIVDVADDQIKFDTNHPLAGETLHFDVEIVELRDATDEELEHGHPHGLDGTAAH